MVSINDFEKQIDDVSYKNEMYSVRDNGAVMRCPKNGKVRQLDNNWTFGKENFRTGYLEIGGERIHRIIATGFLGTAPSQQHLIDHIDTDRTNNRPENLRWVTKLENAILNPLTARQIAMDCGSIENFLTDPAKYKDKFNDPNTSWMCTVSKEEAQNCLEDLKKWSKLDPRNKGENQLADWIFKSRMQPTKYISKIEMQNIYSSNDKFRDSLNANAKQDWKTPTKFPCCPTIITNTPLQDYYNNLSNGSILGENQYTKYKISKIALCKDKIIVLTEDENDNAMKPWCITQITFSNQKFYHSVVKTCFCDDGAEKYFTTAQGLEWTGGDCFDDYC